MRRLWLGTGGTVAVVVLVVLGFGGTARAQSSVNFPEPASSAPPAAAVPAPPPRVPPPVTPTPAPRVAPAPKRVAPTPAPRVAPAPKRVAPVVTTPPPAALPAAPPGRYSLLPPILPYKKGLPVPPGYRVVSRGSGLVLGGGLTLLAGYAAGMGLAASHNFENGLGYAAIPVVGPWAAIGGRSFKCQVAVSLNVDSTIVQNELNKCVRHALNEVTTVVFLTVDGLVQATGAVLLLVGLGSSYEELVRADLPSASFTVLPEGGGALSFSGRF